MDTDMTIRSERFQKTRKRIFEVIQIAGGTDTISRLFDRVIIVLIILSIIITTMQTFSLPENVHSILGILDAVCMIAFTIEYALRLWTADLLYPGSPTPHLRFVVSLPAVIDLFSFLPFYLTGLIPQGVVVFRLIRVARILRLFQINRYLDPVSAILTVLKRKASMIFASLFLVFVLMLSASLLMYYAEHDAQPELFENAFSGLWWAVSTLSTTGYGDIYPVTLLGKALAIVITLLGMCIVAVPTGIITAGFMEAARTTDPRDVSGEDASHRFLDISGKDTQLFSPAFSNPDLSTMEQIPLSTVVGPCVVETLNGEITPERVGAIISKASGEASRRLLLRGNGVLTKEAALLLTQVGIVLTGSSLQSPGEEEICSALLNHNILILGNLDLENINDGEYYLSAAPVIVPGASKAPCRAYLIHM